MRKASATSSGVARGTLPTRRLSHGKRTSRRALVSTFLPAIRSISCRTSLRIMVSMAAPSGDQVESEVEGVEVAPAPSGPSGRELAVAQQRHLLLGYPAMAAQRLAQAGKVVARGRGSQDL